MTIEPLGVETIDRIAKAACEANGGPWDDTSQEYWRRWVRRFSPAFQAHLPGSGDSLLRYQLDDARRNERRANDRLEQMKTNLPDPSSTEYVEWTSDRTYEILDEATFRSLWVDTEKPSVEDVADECRCDHDNGIGKPRRCTKCDETIEHLIDRAPKEDGCQWCACVGYHSETCKGFLVNDPTNSVLPPEAVPYVEYLRNLAAHTQHERAAIDALVAMIPNPGTITIRKEISRHAGPAAKRIGHITIIYEQKQHPAAQPIPVGWEQG